MKSTSLLSTFVLSFALAMFVPAYAQQQNSTEPSAASTEAQPAAPTEEQIQAGEAAAAAGEEAEVQTDEGNRRLSQLTETKIDLGNSESIRVTWMAWPIDGRDFPELAKLQPGQVLAITSSSPPKLWTHADLTFGDLAVKEGNVAENYPGVYGLWLKKTADGWNLVFNNKPDVWGTMYDPGADAGEVPLAYSAADPKADKFTVELKPVSEGNAELHMSWGEHHWSTSLTYGG